MYIYKPLLHTLRALCVVSQCLLQLYLVHAVIIDYLYFSSLQDILISNVYPVSSSVPTCNRCFIDSYLINKGMDEYYLITVAL